MLLKNVWMSGTVGMLISLTACNEVDQPSLSPSSQESAASSAASSAKIDQKMLDGTWKMSQLSCGDTISKPSLFDVVTIGNGKVSIESPVDFEDDESRVHTIKNYSLVIGEDGKSLTLSPISKVRSEYNKDSGNFEITELNMTDDESQVVARAFFNNTDEGILNLSGSRNFCSTLADDQSETLALTKVGFVKALSTPAATGTALSASAPTTSSDELFTVEQPKIESTVVEQGPAEAAPAKVKSAPKASAKSSPTSGAPLREVSPEEEALYQDFN